MILTNVDAPRHAKLAFRRTFISPFSASKSKTNASTVYLQISTIEYLIDGKSLRRTIRKSSEETNQGIVEETTWAVNQASSSSWFVIFYLSNLLQYFQWLYWLEIGIFRKNICSFARFAHKQFEPRSLPCSTRNKLVDSKCNFLSVFFFFFFSLVNRV